MFGKEPSAIIGGITGLVTAILALLVAFKIPLTMEQQVAILGVVAAVAPFIASLVIRQNVASPATLREAGTSLAQVTAVARQDNNAKLEVTGSDAHLIPEVVKE
jgi:ABC-type multidrug transport system fused ATPase/permease subunit